MRRYSKFGDIYDKIEKDPIIADFIGKTDINLDDNLDPEDNMIKFGSDIQYGKEKRMVILTISANGYASLTISHPMPEMHRRAISYELDSEGSIITIHETETPETILNTMHGKKLHEIVEIPGASEYTVDVAVNSRPFIGDKFDTRIAATRV